MADDREVEVPKQDLRRSRKAQVRKLTKNDLAVAIGGLMLGCCTQGCCGSGQEPVLF